MRSLWTKALFLSLASLGTKVRHSVTERTCATMGYSDYKGLTLRTMRAFEQAWPRLSAHGGGSITVPICPDKQMPGTLKIDFADRPIGSDIARTARGVGNQLLKVRLTTFAKQAEVRRRLAHEAVHASQRIMGTLDRDHAALTMYYEDWRSGGGERMDLRRFYKTVAHGDLKTEHEAETVAMLELIRAGDFGQVRDLLSYNGPYLRFDREEWLEMAAQHGVPDHNLEFFEGDIHRLVTGMVALAGDGEGSQNAAIALRQLAQVMRLIDPDRALEMMPVGLPVLEAYAERKLQIHPARAAGLEGLLRSYEADQQYFEQEGCLAPFWRTKMECLNRDYPISEAFMMGETHKRKMSRSWR